MCLCLRLCLLTVVVLRLLAMVVVVVLRLLAVVVVVVLHLLLHLLAVVVVVVLHLLLHLLAVVVVVVLQNHSGLNEVLCTVRVRHGSMCLCYANDLCCEFGLKCLWILLRNLVIPTDHVRRDFDMSST